MGAAEDKAAAEKAAAEKAAVEKAAAEKAEADKAAADAAAAAEVDVTAAAPVYLVALEIRGSRNGEPWPGVGEPIDLTEIEAADYLRFGYVTLAE